MKKALGISGVVTETYSWRSTHSTTGAQIDLVIDRRDDVVNLCEMKFQVKPFVIDKKYDTELRNKTEVFRRETGTNKALHCVMITPYGLQETPYSGSIPNSLKMDILFEHE